MKELRSIIVFFACATLSLIAHGIMDAFLDSNHLINRKDFGETRPVSPENPNGVVEGTLWEHLMGVREGQLFRVAIVAVPIFAAGGYYLWSASKRNSA